MTLLLKTIQWCPTSQTITSKHPPWPKVPHSLTSTLLSRFNYCWGCGGEVQNKPPKLRLCTMQVTLNERQFSFKLKRNFFPPFNYLKEFELEALAIKTSSGMTSDLSVGQGNESQKVCPSYQPTMTSETPRAPYLTPSSECLLYLSPFYLWTFHGCGVSDSLMYPGFHAHEIKCDVLVSIFLWLIWLFSLPNRARGEKGEFFHFPTNFNYSPYSIFYTSWFIFSLNMPCLSPPLGLCPNFSLWLECSFSNFSHS